MEHNWVYEESVFYIDKTIRLLYLTSVEDIQNRVLKDNEEILPFSEYNKLVIPLSPDCTHREVGRVFFDKEIRYIPKTLPRTPSLFVPPVRYIVYRGDPEDNNWIEVERDIPRGGERSNIYQRGHGILKILTAAGVREEYWQQRLKYVVAALEDPTYPEQHTEIINTVFTELMENQSDLQNWFDTTTTLLQSDKGI